MKKRAFWFVFLILIIFAVFTSCEDEGLIRDISKWDGRSYTYDWYFSGLAEGYNTFYIDEASDLAGLATIVNGTAYLHDSRFTEDHRSNFKKNNIMLRTDVDLGYHPWVPIADGSGMLPGVYDDPDIDEQVNYRFCGYFDGGDHIVYGLTNVGYIPDAAKCYKLEDQENTYQFVYGLFGLVRGASIKRLHIEGARIEFNGPIVQKVDDGEGNQVDARFYCAALGAFVGHSRLTFVIKNCSVDGTSRIVNNSYLEDDSKVAFDNIPVKTVTGGLVGKVGGAEFNIESDLQMRNCVFSGYVFDDVAAGGLIGNISCASTITVASVKFDGSIETGVSGGAGGIIGYSVRESDGTTAGSLKNLILTNVEVGGSITGTRYAGGVIGRSATKNFSITNLTMNSIKKLNSDFSSALLIGFISGDEATVSVKKGNFPSKVSIKGEGTEGLIINPLHKLPGDDVYNLFIGGYARQEKATADGVSYGESQINSFVLEISESRIGNDRNFSCNYKYGEEAEGN